MADIKLPPGATLVQPDTEGGIKLPKGATLVQAKSDNSGGERPTADKIIDFLRPFVGPYMGTQVGMATSGALTPLGGAAAGVATNLLADRVMQKVQSKPPSSLLSNSLGLEPGSFGDTTASTLEMELGGKLAGKLVGGVARGAKNLGMELFKPGSISTIPGSTNNADAWMAKLNDALPKHHSLFTTATGLAGISKALLGHHITDYQGAAMGLGGIGLTKELIQKLLDNPSTGRLMNAMVSGQPLGVGEEFAAHQISKALQGSSMAYIDANGNEVPGTLTEKNEFMPTAPPK